MSQGNGALKWILLGCGGLLLLGVCGIGGLFFAIKAGTDAPADATHAFFSDLRGGNHQHALQRMSHSYQATHPLPTFQANVAALPALATQTDSTLTSRSVTNNTATMSGNLSTPEGDIPITVNLSEVGEHWYVDSIMVQGQNLQ